MARHNKDWTREEHILAFSLYCKIPFGQIHMHNPRVIQLARMLGRSVGSVSLKLSNFARLDPALQARGNVAQASRLRVKAASRRQFRTRAPGRCSNPQPRRLRYGGGRAQALPWAEDEKNRLNPRNGLCLNALHDRAFDRHLMWIEDNYVIRFSRKLGEAAGANNETVRWLNSFDGARLLLPRKFAPDLEFLKRHGEKCQARQGKQN